MELIFHQSNGLTYKQDNNKQKSKSNLFTDLQLFQPNNLKIQIQLFDRKQRRHTY